MSKGSWKGLLMIGLAITIWGGVFLWFGYALSNVDCGRCAPHIETWWLAPLGAGLTMVFLSLVVRESSRSQNKAGP